MKEYLNILNKNNLIINYFTTMKKTIILNQEKIFYLPEINEKIYYIILYAVFSLLRRVIPFIIESYKFGKLKEPDFNKSSLLTMLSNFFADFLAGGLYKIYLCFSEKKNKINKNDLIENLDEKECETADPKLEEHKQGQLEIKENVKSNLFYIMIIISIVDTIAQFCLFAFSYYDRNGSVLGFYTNDKNNSDEQNEKIINEDDLIFIVAISILFRYIFSRLIFKIYLYYHIKISIFITIISFIPLIIFNIKTLHKSNKSMVVYIILIIFMNIFYSLEDIMNKLAFMKAIIRPFDIMFYKALIQIPFFILIFIFVILFDNSHPNNMKLWCYLNDNLEKWEGRIAYRLSFIIFNIFRTYFLLLTIEKIDQNDFFIALFIIKALEFVVLSLYSLIKDICFDDGKYIFYFIEFICCIFMFFASCISNEIIIINRFHLAKETNFYKSNKTGDNENDQFEKDQKYIEENFNDVSNDNLGIEEI